MLSRRLFAWVSSVLCVVVIGVVLVQYLGDDAAVAQTVTIESKAGVELGGRTADLPAFTAMDRRQRESVAERRRQEESLAQQEGRIASRPSGKDFDPRSVGSKLRLESLKGYDSQDFRKNPAAYLEQVDEGRLDDTLPYPQSEQEIDEAVFLRPVGARSFDLQPSGKTTLRVQTASRAPVTFVAFDGGLFKNGLSVVTVQANNRGIATVVYYVDEGMTDIGSVFAASPEAVGVVSFSITVLE